MPIDARPEVHVGDIGTLYRARCWDEQLPFDPTTATIKELIFRMPGGVVLTKTATLVAGVGSPATEWFLTYTVTAGAGGGSPVGEFHATDGPVQMQAYLEWADGTNFHSDVRTTDDQGRELRVYRNLD
jgi:hypothetical protein